LSQSKNEYLLGIGLQNWVYKRNLPETNSFDYVISMGMQLVQQIECRKNILKIYLRNNLYINDIYEGFITNLEKDLEIEFGIIAAKHDKHITTSGVINILMYKLNKTTFDTIYGLLRIKGYLSNKDEEQAFGFTLEN